MIVVVKMIYANPVHVCKHVSRDGETVLKQGIEMIALCNDLQAKDAFWLPLLDSNEAHKPWC